MRSRTAASISREVSGRPWGKALRETTGFVTASAGKSHSSVTPTRSSPRPERVHDLGGRRQQGHDLHRGKSPSRCAEVSRSTRSVSARPDHGPVEHPVVEGAAQGAGRPRDDRAVDDQRARLDHPDRERQARAGRQDRGARLAAVAARCCSRRSSRRSSSRGRQRARPGGLGQAADLGAQRADAEGRRRRARPAPRGRGRCRPRRPRAPRRAPRRRRRATRRVERRMLRDGATERGDHHRQRRHPQLGSQGLERGAIDRAEGRDLRDRGLPREVRGDRGSGVEPAALGGPAPRPPAWPRRARRRR